MREKEEAHLLNSEAMFEKNFLFGCIQYVFDEKQVEYVAILVAFEDGLVAIINNMYVWMHTIMHELKVTGSDLLYLWANRDDFLINSFN